jgi:hypothetical protein
MGKVLIGSLTRAYTAAEYATKGEDCPQLGYVFEDEVNAKRYKFVQNKGAAAIGENKAASPYVTGGVTNQVTKAGGALNGIFAGMRPDGATELAQDEYGYLQIAGQAIGINGDSAAAIVAGAEVVVDDDADLGNIGGYASGVTPFGFALESSNTTDAEVDIVINRNCWGQ